MRQFATCVVIVAVVAAVATNGRQLVSAFTLLRSPQPFWLLGCLAATTATFLMATWCVQGATQWRVPFGPTLAVQLASSFTNRLAPAGLGGTATNLRYLERRGLARREAVGALTLNALAGFVVHAALLTGFASTAALPTPHFNPPEESVVLVAAMVALLAGGVLTVTRPAREMAGRLRLSATDQLRKLCDPRCSVTLVAASVGLTVSHIVGLWCALHAFGGPTPLRATAVAYLAASAIGSISPTPGGLGAFEATLVVGLGRYGTSASAATAAVVGYRLVSYWLPLVPGALAFKALRRREHL